MDPHSLTSSYKQHQAGGEPSGYTQVLYHSLDDVDRQFVRQVLITTNAAFILCNKKRISASFETVPFQKEWGY